MTDFRSLPRELRFVLLLLLPGLWLVFTGFRDEDRGAVGIGLGLTVVILTVFLAAVAIIKELRHPVR